MSEGYSSESPPAVAAAGAAGSAGFLAVLRERRAAGFLPAAAFLVAVRFAAVLRAGFLAAAFLATVLRAGFFAAAFFAGFFTVFFAAAFALAGFFAGFFAALVGAAADEWTANWAPCGSAPTKIQSPPGTSIGPLITWAPSLGAWAAAFFASGTLM